MLNVFQYITGILREFRIDSIQNKFESEVLAAQQNLEVHMYIQSEVDFSNHEYPPQNVQIVS